MGLKLYQCRKCPKENWVGENFSFPADLANSQLLVLPDRNNVPEESNGRLGDSLLYDTEYPEIAGSLVSVQVKTSK